MPETEPVNPDWLRSGKRNQWQQRHFRFGKTIRLDIYTPPDEYWFAFRKAEKYKIGAGAHDILRYIYCDPLTYEVDLVLLSVAELGFEDGASYKDICARAVTIGLELCPANVGPALRLAYDDQPPGDLISIAMKAVCGSWRSPGIFALAFNVGQFRDIGLTARYARPHVHFDAGERFVFVRPRAA